MKYHSKCVKGECKCKDELKRHEGKTCKRAPLHSCKTSSDCHPKADCFRGECHCRGRTTGNGDYCRDSMSCPAAAESKCHETSICVLDPLLPIGADKPECKCRDGYQKLEASGSNGPITDATNRNDTKCEEMTDCTMHGIVCPSGTICAQLNGIYDCTCETGFKIVIKAGRKTCQDIDECSEIEPCSSDAVCKNSHGSYECKCNAGYRKNAEDKDYCEDWDECSEMKNPCGVGEKCENQPGTYTCMCDTGYVKAYNGACVKYGECNCQENEECIEGRCKCLEGYKRNKLRHCVHQSHETRKLRSMGMTGNHHYPPKSCSSHKDCPGKGKYKQHAKCGVDNKCRCADMYAGNGDYCRPAIKCRHHTCPKNSNCIINPLTPAKQKCVCKEGFYKHRGQCVAGPRSCTTNNCKSPKGVCNNDNVCQCNGPYAGSGDYCRSAKRCPKNNCGENTDCFIDPLFPEKTECRCELGKRKNNAGKCVECLEKDHCSHKPYSICVKGKCTCEDDLVMGKRKCEAGPLHKCKTDKDCNSRAKCEKGNCICQGATVGNGKFCRDGKKCKKNCGYGTCLKDPLMPFDPPAGMCKCDKGYVLNSKTICVECNNNADCGVYATCDKEVCKCKDELKKEKKTCKPDSQQCPAEHKCGGNHTECVVDPLFTDKPVCKCREGFVESADGKCEEVTECSKKNLVCPNDKDCGQLIDGTFGCVCHKGYEMIEGSEICQDIDECSVAEPCSENGVCKNLDGSYECKCNAGYKNNAADKNVCEDWDECYELDNPCSTGEVCENQQGTYTCLCDKGYVKTAVGGCVKEGLMVNISNVFTQELPTTACTTALGMENGEIKDEQISASSQSSNHARPSLARLNQRKGLGGWCAGKRDENPYLQIDLQRPDTITKVATQGANSNWVEKFSLMFSNDTVHWFDYTVDGLIKMFHQKYVVAKSTGNAMKEDASARKDTGPVCFALHTGLDHPFLHVSGLVSALILGLLGRQRITAAAACFAVVKFSLIKIVYNNF
ncbi:hypothetical protein ACROYT_G023879 [Oculina patagonica]